MLIKLFPPENKRRTVGSGAPRRGAKSRWRRDAAPPRSAASHGPDRDLRCVARTPRDAQPARASGPTLTEALVLRVLPQARADRSATAWQSELPASKLCAVPARAWPDGHIYEGGRLGAARAASPARCGSKPPQVLLLRVRRKPAIEWTPVGAGLVRSRPCAARTPPACCRARSAPLTALSPRQVVLKVRRACALLSCASKGGQHSPADCSLPSCCVTAQFSGAHSALIDGCDNRLD